jgi:type II secretory pathway predicted ATPase ExeA
MNQFAEAKRLFYDDFDLSGYFDSLTFEYAKKQLIDAMRTHEIPLVFLLGNPGTGKSFLLNYIQKNVTSVKVAKYFTHPYFDEKEFLSTLLSLAGPNIEPNQYSTEQLISRLKRAFGDLEYTVFIDEAQLLSDNQIELIRILSDQKIFQFVLAMHKKEGNNILQKEHFKSRTNKRIELEGLSENEIARYIEQRLLSNNFSDIASMFNKSHIRFIHKYSQGNFRTTKKIVKTLLEILNIANREDYKKYQKPNRATLTMAAIDAGLIDVK